jgi:hypothetical protein
MSLIATAKSSGNFDPVPEGVHIATCIWVIDLGEQFNEKWGKVQHKVLIGWELPDETIEINGELLPRMISATYTMSLSEKSLLRSHLEAWRGKSFTEKELEGFNVGNILGKCCQVQVIHSKSGENTYANVRSVMALPKGMPAPAPQNETILFSMDDRDSLDKIVVFPQWVQERIKKSQTYQQLMAQEDGFEDVEDDGPLPWEEA